MAMAATAPRMPRHSSGPAGELIELIEEKG
jgi:hypothetical protein